MAESQKKGEAFELRVKALLEQHGFQVERDVLIAGNQIDLVARRSASMRWLDRPVLPGPRRRLQGR